MAFNAYFPATYQPFPQNYMQPQYQQPVQQASTGIQWVAGPGEANAYPVAPNNAVALWDSSSPVIYLKQADASGKPSVKVFDLVERKAAAPAETTVDYATKRDVEELSAALRVIREDVDSVLAKKKVKKEDAE